MITPHFLELKKGIVFLQAFLGRYLSFVVVFFSYFILFAIFVVLVIFATRKTHVRKGRKEQKNI